MIVWRHPIIRLFALLLVLSGCKVERTPREFYDDRYLPAPDLEERRHQIETSLAPLREIRSVEDVQDAVAALRTTPDAQIVRTERPIADDAPLPASELSVMVAETGDFGWFVSRHGEAYAITGVSERRDGSWRVVQLHAGAIQRQQAGEEPDAPAG